MSVFLVKTLEIISNNLYCMKTWVLLLLERTFYIKWACLIHNRSGAPLPPQKCFCHVDVVCVGMKNWSY